MKALIVSLILMAGCLHGCATASWERPYSVKNNNPNLTTEVAVEGHPFYLDDTMLEVYEELPKCERFYLGTVRLKSGSSNSITLPIGKELVVFMVKRSQTFGYAEENDASVRFRPKANESYQVSFRERKGSQEILFKVKSSGEKFHEMAGLGERNCKEIKVINLK